MCESVTDYLGEYFSAPGSKAMILRTVQVNDELPNLEFDTFICYGMTMTKPSVTMVQIRQIILLHGPPLMSPAISLDQCRDANSVPKSLEWMIERLKISPKALFEIILRNQQ